MKKLSFLIVFIIFAAIGCAVSLFFAVNPMNIPMPDWATIALGYLWQAAASLCFTLAIIYLAKRFSSMKTCGRIFSIIAALVFSAGLWLSLALIAGLVKLDYLQ